MIDDEEDNDNDEEIIEMKQKINELETKLSPLEAQAYNKGFSNYMYKGRPISNKIIEKIKDRELPVSREPKTHQVKGILSTKQLILLGIGIIVLLLFITGNLTQTNNELKIPQFKLPEWKLPEPETGSTHVKKTIEDLTRWTNKQNEENRWKRFDSYETVLGKKYMVDGMDCTQLIDFMLTNTRSEFQAYSAFLILERGCVIP